MAVFLITAKRDINSGKCKVQKGMSVEVVTSSTASPLNINAGKDVVAAFKTKYGMDISGFAGPGNFEAKKLG